VLGVLDKIKLANPQTRSVLSTLSLCLSLCLSLYSSLIRIITCPLPPPPGMSATLFSVTMGSIMFLLHLSKSFEQKSSQGTDDDLPSPPTQPSQGLHDHSESIRSGVAERSVNLPTLTARTHLSRLTGIEIFNEASALLAMTTLLSSGPQV
jgi:hypothetical protein